MARSLPLPPTASLPGRRVTSGHIVAVVVVSAAVASLLACTGDGSPRGEKDLSLESLPPDVIAAIDVVAGLQDATIGIMQRGPDLGYEGRYAAIEAVARVSFDIPALARASYGPGFADLSPDQKRQWVEIFEQFHISSLADVRDRYRGQTYRTIGYSAPAPGIVLLQTKLDYPDRAVDLYTDYRVRETPRGWRIVDVHAPPSVSEVAMRRSEYRTVIDRHGFDGLVEEMEARIKRRQRP